MKNEWGARVVTFSEFAKLRPSLGKVVATSGGFDPIHPGHISCIIESKKYGDCLVVIVNGDNFLTEKKGRPFQNLETRSMIVSGIAGVDYVVPFEIKNDQTVSKALQALKPDVFTKGGDRVNKKSIPEWETCQKNNIEVKTGVGLAKKWSSSWFLEEWSNGEKMSNKKVIAFDLDDTLSESKSQADDRMVELLGKLLEKFHVCVISGGKLEQFKKQLPFITSGAGHQLENMHLMPTCGTRYYVYDLPKNDWQKVYAEDFLPEDKKKIIQAMDEALDETGFRPEKHYGELIEDRGSQVTVSAVGQEAPVDVKKQWDPEDIKKYQLRDAIARRIPEFEVRAGGMTSIDVTKQGIDKAYGMKKLMEILDVDKSDILFFGDKLHEGGNDYPVKNLGIDSVAVRDWKDTALALEVVLALAN